MRARVLVWMCFSLLAGCPGRLEDPELFVGATGDSAVTTCTLGTGNVELQLVRPRCATANCHDRAGRAGSLDLESPGVASRLLNVRSPACAGQILVNPGAGTGYLIDKLTGAARCGRRMPQGAPALSPSEVACVRAWITTLGMDAAVPMDAARDVAMDTPRDVAPDTAMDVRADVTVDVRTDAVSEAPADVTDAGEVGADAEIDVADAGVDAGIDAGPDAADATEVGADAGIDATSDADDASADLGPDATSDVRDD